MPAYSNMLDFAMSKEEYVTLRSIADALIRGVVNGESDLRDRAIEYAGIIDTVFGPEVDEPDTSWTEDELAAYARDCGEEVQF